MIRAARAARTAVAILVLASLAAAAAPVAWHLAGWVATPAASRPPSAPAATPAEPPDLDPILALAPFGAPPAPDPAPAAPAAETSLDLVLEGVLMNADPAASLALISQEGVTAGYRPGDQVAAVATLRVVEATRVLLEVEGELQVLSFPEAEGGEDGAEEPAVALSGPDRLRQLVASQTESTGEEDDAGAVEPAAPETIQDHLDLWRERIKANPAEVLDTIGLIATPEGYRIADDHDSGVDLAGLRAGDVVRSVNGRAVGDVDQDRQTFDDVAASGLARIEVQRGDRTLTLTFPLQ